MTPRQVGRGSVNAEFARQLAERNAKANPKKQFKSSAPKGVKLAAGYTDRTKSRVDEEEDETAQRIKKLQESMKLGQIDRDMFEKLVQEITDGDIASTHLVKGLDRKLLEKVRRGEVALGESAKEGDAGSDVEDEFDELAEQELAPVVHEKVEKKGQMAPPPPVAGVKRTRDQILAELKAQRQAAAEAAAAEHQKKFPSLGPGFRKIGPGGESTRIEVDAHGREILIITGPDGKEKRKIRKAKPEEPKVEPRFDLENPDKPLAIHQESLPAPKPAEPEEEEDDDIFTGVGSSYNPLGNLDEEEDDESSEEEKEQGEAREDEDEDPVRAEEASDDSAEALTPDARLNEKHTQPTDAAKAPIAKPRRNYFNDRTSSAVSKDSADATVLAALKKVRTLDANSTLLQDSAEARLAKRAAELASRDRDMEDLDMGFGASRFDDADEMEHEGEKVKFSEWKGLGADEDDEDEQGERGGKKRKRGGKKKKGDKNSAADVLKVMERQKGGG
ncbi:hypothetical protein K491DRAFT_208560 [Lophiostoma macrostomum CBS 122681]|uniref:RED-like N-terminal domain-containing protein n=1 Tax=Lophiostoma macrostomum CBS 122681 TaxID=1314788 RepID=A0A6A6SSZ8_9PLEO|nr:hypothetical protein K491DRAFT_208560 [Lophiostoma macrostomum CBS 122681]